MTGETERTGSEVAVLERKAKVSRSHLLRTVDALMDRRTRLFASVERVKSAFYLLPIAMTGVGALVALGVGGAGLRNSATRRVSSRNSRPRSATALTLLGVGLVLGILAGLQAARHHE